MSAYTEGALRSLEEKASAASGFDPWAHAQSRGFDTAKRWAQKQGPFNLPNTEQGYRDLMKIKTFQERSLKENHEKPSEETIAAALSMRTERVRELLAWDELRREEIRPGGHEVPHAPSAEEVFERKQEEEERQRAFEIVRKEARKLPSIKRKVALAIMGEDAVENATQRIGISTSAFYRERNKARRSLKKLRPIWGRFGKVIKTAPFELQEQVGPSKQIPLGRCHFCLTVTCGRRTIPLVGR